MEGIGEDDHSVLRVAYYYNRCSGDAHILATEVVLCIHYLL